MVRNDPEKWFRNGQSTFIKETPAYSMFAVRIYEQILNLLKSFEFLLFDDGLLGAQFCCALRFEINYLSSIVKSEPV